MTALDLFLAFVCGFVGSFVGVTAAWWRIERIPRPLREPRFICPDGGTWRLVAGSDAAFVMEGGSEGYPAILVREGA